MTRFESSFYSVEQVNALLDAVKDDPLYPLIKLTVVYGLRRSEVLGLKWDSIDFTAKTLIVKHTVSKVTKAVHKDKTKMQQAIEVFRLYLTLHRYCLI